MTDTCNWLAAAAVEYRRLADLHHAFCDHLFASGLPIWRASLGLEVLHPETSGAQFRWVASVASIEIMPRSRTVASEIYDVSPVKIVDDTRRTYRRRLDAPPAAMPLLVELKQAGATDYVIIPLPFLDRERTAHMSYATRAPGGFSDDELIRLEEVTRLFSPYAERYVLKRIAIDMLDIYLGHRSGERVFSGAIERGTVETIRAAICMTDLNGFTRYSDEQSIEEVLATLNAFFEVMAEALEAEGGEVLKFMGDAILATFPEADNSLREPCRAAIAAVRKACDGMDALNASRRREGRSELSFGLALHAGEVAYGNIGARARLDFTVIGPAVNHTSRLVELSKKLNRPVLVSGAFVEASGLPLARLGKYRLRDVARSHDVYTLEEAVAPAAKSAKMRK